MKPVFASSVILFYYSNEIKVVEFNHFKKNPISIIGFHFIRKHYEHIVRIMKFNN